MRAKIQQLIAGGVAPPISDGEHTLRASGVKRDDSQVARKREILRTRACVDMDRFQRLDWPIQKERILAFCRKWRGLLVMDASGAGDPIYDDLVRVWPRIEAVKFTNQKKAEPIQRLVVAIEQRQVSWPREWETLTDELKRYEYAIGSSGTITYSAPNGFHDDAVIALALSQEKRYTPRRNDCLAAFHSERVGRRIFASPRRLH